MKKNIYHWKSPSKMHQNLTFVLLKQEDKSLKNIYKKNIIESYDRCTIHDIAKALGILVSQVRPEAQTMSARLISLILTDDQKQVRVKMLSNCFNCYLNSIKENFQTLLRMTKHGCNISNQ